MAGKAKYEEFHQTLRAYEEEHAGDAREFFEFDVEREFDRFVSLVGGRKISDLLTDKHAMPLNADYAFANENVVVELKTLMGARDEASGLAKIGETLIDSGLTIYQTMNCLFGSEPIPPHSRKLVDKRFRRYLEKRISKARKQCLASKSLLGNEATKTMIVVANDDGNRFFSQSYVLYAFAILMDRNYSKGGTDCWVYINPNFPATPTDNQMQYNGWFPAYCNDDTNRQMSPFVDELGSKWLRHCAATRGSPIRPILRIPSFGETLELLN